MSDPLSEFKLPQEKLPDNSGEAKASASAPGDGAGASDGNAPSAPQAAAKPSEAKAGAPKTVRRTGAVARKPAEGAPAVKAAPTQPDRAKNIAFAICGLLLLGILGLGIYMLVHKRPAPPPTPPMANLSPEAKELAEKALRAEKLYSDGKALAASSEKLEDLRTADEKLTEANKLFNEIVDQNQSVEGFKAQIDLARDKKLSIDKELGPIRKKIDDLEGEERVKKAKAAQGDKPNPATPIPDAPAAKEPSDEDLSDANIKSMIDRDPSEAEKLIKARQKKDPTYKPPVIP